MKIFATDIDSVLLDITTPMVNHFSTLYPGKECHYQGVHHWDIGLSYGVPKEDVDAMWGHVFGSPCPFEHGAEEFVERLKEEGYTVIGVTSRIPAYQAALLRDVAPLGLDDVLFPVGDKQTVLEMLSPVAFIDDKIANLQDSQRAGVPLNILFDQPWNFSLDLNVPYKRVELLEDVFELLQ